MALVSVSVVSVHGFDSLASPTSLLVIDSEQVSSQVIQLCIGWAELHTEGGESPGKGQGLPVTVSAGNP